MPGRRPAVPARAQPRLHRPGQHGRVDRGARAVRRPGRRRAAFSFPGSDKIRGRQAKVALKRGRGGVAAARDRAPAEGLVRRAAARLGAAATCASSSTTCCVGGELVRIGMIRRDGAAPQLIADEHGRPRGPRQADLAAAVPGALVPQRAVAGRGGMTDSRHALAHESTEGSDEADRAELQVRGARRARRARPGVPARRRAGAVAVLADLDRHRDDEGRARPSCRWSARPGPGRTRCARCSTRCSSRARSPPTRR